MEYQLVQNRVKKEHIANLSIIVICHWRRRARCSVSVFLCVCRILFLGITNYECYYTKARAWICYVVKCRVIFAQKITRLSAWMSWSSEWELFYYMGSLRQFARYNWKNILKLLNIFGSSNWVAKSNDTNWSFDLKWDFHALQLPIQFLMSSFLSVFSGKLWVACEKHFTADKRKQRIIGVNDDSHNCTAWMMW